MASKFKARKGYKTVAKQGYSSILNTSVQSITNKFIHRLDFANNSYVGGTQPIGNNTADGRFLRDSGNFSVVYIEDKDGLLVSCPSSGIRRSSKGLALWPSVSILGRWGADFTNALWIKTNCTAARGTGADGVVNAGSTLTATADGATCAQQYIQASADQVLSVYMRRVSGSGIVNLSLNAGVTNNPIVLTDTFKEYYISLAAITDPTMQITLQTAGDVIGIDFCMPHGAINSHLRPLGYKVRTVGTAYGSVARSTPWALNTDVSPLYADIQGSFACYWEGISYRPSGGGMYVSDGAFQLQIFGADGVNAGNISTATAGQFKANGLINKVYMQNVAGVLTLCINGNTPIVGTNALWTTGTHFVFSSNGAGAQAIHGFQRKGYFSPNLALTTKEMQLLTT